MDKILNSEIMLLKSVELDDANNALVLLDQTLLPAEKKFIRLTTQEEIWEAINSLRVRGAPAIGIAAGYGCYLGVKQSRATKFEDFMADFISVKKYLATSRPTAVNLFWALERMEERLMVHRGQSIDEIKEALRDESEKIRDDDEKVCEAIGMNGLTLLKPGWGLLTHCNAGTIATAKYGTALSPVYIGNSRGYNFRVFADETRPLLQGARLTAWELHESGVDVTLICDNMASVVMREGKIQAVLVGCDRVAANGDAANKIGTSGVAILAKYYNIPFYVCAPLSTIDMKCKNGEDIHIEMRDGCEITDKWYEKPMAPNGVSVYNPCFDVTENSLITAIITEKGICYPPYTDSISKMFEK